MGNAHNRGFKGATGTVERRFGRFCVGIVALVGVMTVGARAARAGGTQIHDGFETSPTDWSFEQGGTRAFMSVSTSSNARSPSHMGNITYLGGGSTSEWAAIGKLFFWNQSQQGGTVPVFTSCGAAMYVKTPTGAKGQLEVINPFDDTYIAVKPFNLGVTSNWVLLSAPNVFTCTSWLEVRIVLDNTTQGQVLWADDATVQWVF